MNRITVEIATQLKKETELQFVRSQGPGGQNVNKTNSAVQLRWNLWESKSFSSDQKNRIQRSLSSALTTQGDILLKVGNFRDQEQNVKAAFERFFAMLEKALHVPKARKATKPTRASKMRRLDGKKRTGEIKKLRKTTFD